MNKKTINYTLIAKIFIIIIIFNLIAPCLFGCVCEHEWGDAETIKTATCTEEGQIQYTCLKCNEKKTESTPLINHKFAEKSTTATCTSSGTTTYKCTKCGYEKNEYTPAFGHDYKQYICTLCGKIDPSLSLFHFNMSIYDFAIVNSSLVFSFQLEVSGGTTAVKLTAIPYCTYTQYAFFSITIIDATLKKEVLFMFGGTTFKKTLRLETWNSSMSEPYNGSHTYYAKASLFYN